MKPFLALLTGGGLAVVGGLVSGWLTNWLGDKRDKRRYTHEQKMAREARRQDRLELAYIELGKYLSRYGDWARAVRPLIGSVPLPDPLPPEEKWRIETLVRAYGSPKVRQLLGQWEDQAKKIENADHVIQLLDQVSNPSSQLDAEAHKEQLALPGYKDTLFKAEDAIRDQMSRELVGDEPPALTGKLGQSVNHQVDLGTAILSMSLSTRSVLLGEALARLVHQLAVVGGEWFGKAALKAGR